MHITYGTEKEHATKLKRGLKKLGNNFVAEICYWCEGTGRHDFEQCHVCGRDKQYGTSLGLLCGLKPASDSVVNQVLIAGES
jgi:rubrerythrin